MDHSPGVYRAWAILALFPLGMARSTGQQVPPVDPQEPDTYRISVNVDLVVLHATVRDGKGRFASNLRAQDFKVYEEGVRQTIRLFRHEDTPVTVGLVVDHSGSMKRKLADVITAARTFVRASNPEDEMFVVNFNEHVSLGLPESTRFTNRPDELENAILKTPADGMTALYDAVSVALGRLQTGGREKKVLIVISDGGDNASKRKLAEALTMAAKSSALVYTVGIFDEDDPDRNPGVLNRLARATGGEAYMPDNFSALPAVCERIARDIRHQYTIGYVPANPAQRGAYRAIRVVAAAAGAGKLSVRARDGYVAGGESPPFKDGADR
ncbi:MAG TPA: VWA domain-containing protein [Paludibaculum sp.]|jgi:VWFA-related protein